MTAETPTPEDMREAARILRAVAETETDEKGQRDNIIRAELRGAARALDALAGPSREA
ncbi:hypothetical protein [Micrococcus luteus]|uniref:hypothetical protein n=1 Tax=Micrococcus luteus TaxID=1270 RepID=UPI0015E111C2|nr:hypothetical protein [Micrococcus luteus]MBS9536538.1 hypothetical protein [Micrococcus luteus]